MIDATLEALAVALTPSERQAVSEQLPLSLRGTWELAVHLPNIDVSTLYDRVQRSESVTAGRAREQVQIVCRALAEMLPDETVTLLRRRLPQLAPLFYLPEPTPSPEVAERIERPRDPELPDGTLATGRPGSRHPLYDARPERAHAHSIARSDNPHGDTKLSSAHGFTQERERETLATGRPGSKRPLSG
jgi:uncharacterized protein (DUF2267 family)